MMPRITIDVPQLRVVRSMDIKGNPVAYLELMGQPVLYADEDTLDHLDTDGWEDVFQTHVAGLFADLLLQRAGDALKGWTKTSPTGREVLRVGHDGDAG